MELRFPTDELTDEFPAHLGSENRDDRLFPAEFHRRVALDRLGIEPDELPGGHLVALSRPVELADRLGECLRTLP